MVAWSVSGSGVDIKCIPRVWERPSVFSILSIKCSIFIVLIPFWFCLKAKIQQIIEIGREKEEKIINKTKYAIKNEKRYLHPCKGQDIYQKRFFSESHDPLLFFPAQGKISPCPAVNFSLPRESIFMISFYSSFIISFLYSFSSSDYSA